MRGVALLLDQTIGQSVSEVECISDRLLRVGLKGTPVDIVVIKVYMPTTDNRTSNTAKMSTVVPATKDPLMRDQLVLCDGPLSAPNSIFCTFCTPILDRTPT